MIKKIIYNLALINLIIILGLVNGVLTFYPNLRIDLSQNKIHSLSKSSKTVVRNLTDLVNIKVFLTADLPSEMKPYSESLKTILAEIEKANPRRVKLAIVDPNKDDMAKSEAQRLGIEEVQFSRINADKFEVQTGYFGLTVGWGNKVETVPIVSDVTNLEYVVVSTIKKAIKQSRETIAVQFDEPATVTNLEKALSQNYQLLPVNLNSTGQLPEGAKMMLLVGMGDKLTDPGREKLEAWLKEKNLIALVDTVEIGPNLLATIKDNPNLEAIFKDKGITMEKKLVADSMGALANFRLGNSVFITRYPYWPEINPANMDNSLPIFSGINSLTLAWAAPLKLEGGAKYLFKSSQLAQVDDGLNNLNPGQNPDLGGKEQKAEVLAAINNNGGSLAVISDSDWVRDQFVVNNQQNLDFVLNLVDYFGQNKELMGLRAKNLAITPLKTTSERTKIIIKTIGLVAPIAMLGMVWGLGYWWRKKYHES